MTFFFGLQVKLGGGPPILNLPRTSGMLRLALCQAHEQEKEQTYDFNMWRGFAFPFWLKLHYCV